MGLKLEVGTAWLLSLELLKDFSSILLCLLPLVFVVFFLYLIVVCCHNGNLIEVCWANVLDL